MELDRQLQSKAEVSLAQIQRLLYRMLLERTFMLRKFSGLENLNGYLTS